MGMILSIIYLIFGKRKEDENINNKINKINNIYKINNCIYCDKKIKELHCSLCHNCNTYAHINCQIKQPIKNICKKCNNGLKIYTNLDYYYNN